jgi:DNA (cytosine-5)-methyltransferase 1
MKKTVSAVDLFCGAGGLTHGFILEGIKVKAGVDIDPRCQYPFEHNNNSVFLKRDISDIASNDILPYFPKGETKLLAGCAPCPPFSTYSQGPRGSKDERWTLLKQFARLTKEICPEIVSMENVPKLSEHEVFSEFVTDLRGIGYNVVYYIVDCRYYGVPQNRKRLVLFASRFGEIEIEEPTHNEHDFVTVRETIGDLERLSAGGVSKKDPLHCASVLSEKNLERIRASEPGGTWRDWDRKLRSKCHRKTSGRSYPSVYGRMSWDEPSPTITTQSYGFGNGRFGHPVQNRAISLREAALLQTFPKNYAFSPPGARVYVKSTGRLIGNAVPVILARVIARSILKHLDDHDN